MACAAAIAAPLLLSPPADAAPRTERVLTGFRGRPDTSALIALGAHVRHTYDLVPAVAVAAPSSRIAAIRGLKSVLYVEPDPPIYASRAAGAPLAVGLFEPGGRGTVARPASW